MSKMKTIGTLSDIQCYQKTFPNMKLSDMEDVLNGRKFTRWYKRNKRVVNRLAFAVPAFTLTLCRMIPGSPLFNFYNPVMAVAAAGATGTFLGGNGVILVHMLFVGFVTLIVSSFLKFTGRGDLIPLVGFVAGAAIMVEVIGLFNQIYASVKTLMSI